MDDLADFAAKFSTHRTGAQLSEFSRFARALPWFDDPQRADAMIATMFWRAWLASDLAHALVSAVTPSGYPPGSLRRSRTIIVPQPKLLRFDLLILDPVMKQWETPRTLSAILPGEMTDILLSAAARAARENPLPGLESVAVQLAVDAVANPQQPWEFVLGPEPQQERLSLSSSPLLVDDQAGHLSTAGVLVEDLAQAGRTGVTAALHGVDGATSVLVNGSVGSIVRTDSITDSAFIEVDVGSISSVPNKGIMSAFAPRGNQSAEFRGAKSGVTPTIISGWDAQVPNPSARRQACVYTRRDAQAGDSGSALLTDDGWIAGFAFERSKPNETPAQCSWIWADSVLNRLNVKLI
jgi:hypothetical protein